MVQHGKGGLPMTAEEGVDWRILASNVQALMEAIEKSRNLDNDRSVGPMFLKDAETYYRFRRTRDKIFDNRLFADPAWDMLLDLFIAKLTKKRISVSSLCIASAVPATTALGWIAHMEERYLIRRTSDADDRRRIYVELTEQAYVRMNSLFIGRQAVTGHHRVVRFDF